MTENIKRKLKLRTKLTKYFYKNGQINVIMIKYWKNLQNARRKLLRLKRTTFLI